MVSCINSLDKAEWYLTNKRMFLMESESLNILEKGNRQWD